MLLPTLIGAVGLLSTVAEAAPKGSEFSTKVHPATVAIEHERRYQAPEAFKPRAAPRPRVAAAAAAAAGESPLVQPRHIFSAGNNSTATSPVVTRTETVRPGYTSPGRNDTTTACPTDIVVVSTATVDVTIYVSAGANVTVTQPCDEEATPASQTHASEAAETTEPCTTDGYQYGNSSSSYPSKTAYCPHPGGCDEETSDPYQGPTYVFPIYPDPPDSTHISGNQTAQPYTRPGYSHSTTEPCDDDVTSTFVTTISSNGTTQTHTSVITYSDPASTEPCDDETMSSVPGNATMQTRSGPDYALPTKKPYGDGMTSTLVDTISGNGTTQTQTRAITYSDPEATSEPCDDDVTSTLGSTATAPGNQTMQTYPRPSHASTSTDPGDDDTTSTAGSSPSATLYPSIPPYANISATSTEPCIIDTSMTPIATATLDPYQPPQPPRTDYGDEDTAQCGVSGAPGDIYFIAEFAEDRPRVAVTLEGCYQFCHSDMESTQGCQAYRFFHEGTGGPRCALYSASVSSSVGALSPGQSDRWYDLTCGSPAAEEGYDDDPVGDAGAAIDIGVDIGIDI